MDISQFVKGFSRLSKEEKLDWIVSSLPGRKEAGEIIRSYWHHDPAVQKILDEISENTIINFYLPYGIAPNFLINGKVYQVHMVTEESSVIAAASAAAKFWFERGGFHSKVLSTVKTRLQKNLCR